MMICGRNEQHTGKLNEEQAFRVSSSSNTNYIPLVWWPGCGLGSPDRIDAVTVPCHGEGFLCLPLPSHLNQQANTRHGMGTNAETLAGMPTRYERAVSAKGALGKPGQ